MRVFIAFLPCDPVASYHRGLVRDLATRFGFKISAGFFPTHFTLKAPFEASEEQIVKLKNLLASFAKILRESSETLKFTVDGFKDFDKSIVALGVTPCSRMAFIIATLQETLRGFTWITWSEYEPLKNLHITIAKNFSSEKFFAIWKYLAGKQPPHFELLFDHVALLRFEDAEWIVDSIYSLKP